MEAWGWLAVVAGILLAFGVFLDVFFTTLHPDVEGRIARRLQRTTWRASIALGNRVPRFRRQVLAFAGPLMVALTFMVWIGLFILSIALIVWPNLNAYRTEPEFEVLGFVDALYYAGITVSVLGYGDISPTSPWLQTLAWVASAAGFGMLTAIVAYILELVSSLDERNRFSLQVHDETGGTERGVELVLRYVLAGSNDLADRYVSWADHARQVQDKMHRYALTTLYYRARDPAYDPEPTLRIVGEAVAAGYLLVSDPRHRHVAPAVEELDLAVVRLMGTISDQYLSRSAMSHMEVPEILLSDHDWVASIGRTMSDQLGDAWPVGETPGPALAIAARTRGFIDALTDVTDWTRADYGPRPNSEVDHDRADPKGRP